MLPSVLRRGTPAIRNSPEESMATAAALNPEAPAFLMPTSLNSETTAISFNPDAPEFKPVTEMSLRPEAAEFIPMVGGWAMLQGAVDAYQHIKQKREMPYATDEEWDQRIAKREKEVETIKSLQSYRLYIEVFPHDKRGDDDPKTPDPRDRSVSKRMWKWNVEKWRLLLKSRCVYSRSVMIQCRELLRRHAEKAAAASVAGEGASGGGSGSGGALDDDNTKRQRGGSDDRNPLCLTTVNIPERSSFVGRKMGIPYEANDKPTGAMTTKKVGAGTFQ